LSYNPAKTLRYFSAKSNVARKSRKQAPGKFMKIKTNINSIFVFRIVFSTILFFMAFVHAEAQEQTSRDTTIPVMIFGENNEPLALIGLEDVIVNSSGEITGCDNRLGLFEVDDIAYEGVSEIVGGIRVKKIRADIEQQSTGNVPSLIRINAGQLSNLVASWLPTLVQKGSRLLIAYNICGNGGFQYARDIYRAESLEW
jgi:hypothetical protein